MREKLNVGILINMDTRSKDVKFNGKDKCEVC